MITFSLKSPKVKFAPFVGLVIWIGGVDCAIEMLGRTSKPNNKARQTVTCRLIKMFCQGEFDMLFGFIQIQKTRIYDANENKSPTLKYFEASP